MTDLVLLIHILWVNKKSPTSSDSQRRFASRKIKVECGKAWGLCAPGREGVRWACIYSKARTARGFHKALTPKPPPSSPLTPPHHTATSSPTPPTSSKRILQTVWKQRGQSCAGFKRLWGIALFHKQKRFILEWIIFTVSSKCGPEPFPNLSCSGC